MSNITGVEIHDVLGLSKPLVKFVESVSLATGKLYEPTNVVKMAKARAKELEIISTAVNENLNLPVKYEDGSVSIDATNANELVIRAQNRFLFQEMQKQQNIDSVVEKAYRELEKETSVSDDPVEKEWLLRLFNSIEDISNEKMQSLWGKILAGEIKRPKTFSLRSIDILRNISRDEAVLFEALCQYRICEGHNIYLPNYEKVLKKYRIDYASILMLDDCGLIRSAPLQTLMYQLTRDRHIITENEDLIVVLDKKRTETVTLSIKDFSFTTAGIELSKLFSIMISNEYLIEFAKALKENHQDVEVHVYKKVEKTEDEIVHNSIDLIAENNESTN